MERGKWGELSFVFGVGCVFDRVRQSTSLGQNLRHRISEILKMKIRIPAAGSLIVPAVVVPTSRKARDVGHPSGQRLGSQDEDSSSGGGKPMVPAVVVPTSRNARDAGHLSGQRLGSQDEDSNSGGGKPMVPAVVVPTSRNARDVGPQGLGGACRRIQRTGPPSGFRDVGLCGVEKSSPAKSNWRHSIEGLFGPILIALCRLAFNVTMAPEICTTSPVVVTADRPG